MHKVVVVVVTAASSFFLILFEDATSVEDVMPTLGSLTAPSWGRFWQGTWQSREHGKTRMWRKELCNKGWMGPVGKRGDFRTVARTELGKDSSVMPVKGQLRGINFRRDKSKNRIRIHKVESQNFLDLVLV